MGLSVVIRYFWLFLIILIVIAVIALKSLPFRDEYQPQEVETDKFTIILPVIYKINIAKNNAEQIARNCPYKCRVISFPDATPLELLRSKLIVWHLIWTDVNMTQFKWLSHRRNPAQLWAFMSHEPPEVVRLMLPSGLKDFQQFDGHFNWTFTYRVDSDVYNPVCDLEGFEPIEPGEPPYLPAIHVPIANKKHLAAIISNCGSYAYGRVALMKDLARHGLSADIYGSCGIPCPGIGGKNRMMEKDVCKQFIAENYLFYASFENSLCPDYVSEKFGASLSYNMVPVVVGGANYTRLGPPHSFINARDFSSIEAFVQFIKQLSTDEVAYNKYFEWRSKYRLKYFQRAHVCSLCKKLYEEKHTSKYISQTYDDFTGWWQHAKPCQTSVFTGWLNSSNSPM